MTNLRQAAQAALEGLKQARDAVQDWGCYAGEHFQKKHNLQGDLDAIQASITALRAALAEPTQQPLTNEQLVAICKEALASYRRWNTGVRGQQMRPEDSLDWHVARAVERAHGIGGCDE